MADKTVIIKLDVQEAGAIASIEGLNDSLKKLDKTSDEYAVILKKIQAEETKLASIQKQRAGAQKSVTKALNKQNDATGSATAATMELSRVVSDAPYGIRGMANNITQLVSQLGSASKKAGGLGGALKLMGKQLMGPLGIVFLITAAVSALDYFYGAATKADKSINSVAESAAKSASALKILVKANDSGTMSTEETAKAVKKANSEYKDLNIQVGKNGKITDESVLAINRKITSLENLARATALQGLVEEKFAKLIPLENKLKTQEEEALVKLRIKGINSIKEAQAIADDKKFTAEKGYVTGVLNQANFTKSKIDGIQKDIDELIETIPNIDDLFKGTEGKDNGKVKKISPFKTPEELELDVKNNLSAIDKLQRNTEIQLIKNKQKEELSLANTEEQKKQIKEKYASENLEVQIKYELKALDLKAKIEKTAATEKQNAYVKGLDAKLVAYEKSLRNEKGVLSKASKDSLAIATTETETLKKKSKEELAVTVFGIQEEYAKLFPFWVQLAEARRDALGIGTDEGEEDSIKKWFDKYAFHAEQAKALISGVADFVDSEFERELVIEQNKTNALNNELNKRLLNENLSKDQKKAIQLQISQNDEKLRIRQEQIARKRFKVMKAFNLATALTDTYLATQKAYLSQLQLDPTSPIRAKIAAGIALASGLANVAAIARTKFESSAGSSPALAGGGSSGGGGDSRAEPSFNIVGRSEDSLLINAIQAQFDKPLKAYVVARDVTNQQQLDGIITSQAGV